MKKPSAFVVGLFHDYINNEPKIGDKLKAAYNSEYGFVAAEGKWGPFAAPFLTPAHLAKAFAVSQKTLERWRLDGNGPSYLKVGKQIRYPVSELDRWVRLNLINHG